MKKYIFFLLAMLLMANSGRYISAADVNMDLSKDVGEDILTEEKETVTETILSDDIKKVERAVYLNYNYGEEFLTNDYKYKTVRLEVSYFDISKNYDRLIASAYMEFNFRYNTTTNDAKCLSTIHGQMCNDKKYSLKLFSRPKNLSYSDGESDGSITFNKKGMLSTKCIDRTETIFYCDSFGDITYKIQKR